MRHYEIIFLIHPDQGDQVTAMSDRYRTIIETDGGKIHRFENWGVRKLAYPISQTYKAYYILMNIECTQEALTNICEAFRFNDAIIRNLVIKRDKKITQVSPMMEALKKEVEDSGAKEETSAAS